MTAKYFAILTNYGAAQLANAVALGTKLNISVMAVGDGGGVLPIPDPAQTKLIRETRRAAVNQVSVDDKNPNYIISEQVIPENEGGWFIREIGLFDDKGGLIAVGNAPETYKPNLQEGSGRTQVIQMVLMVSSTESITLKVDPSVVLATREYVTKSIAAAIQESEAKAAKTYQPKGSYANKGDSYTKPESDGRFQPKGSYQPAGNYYGFSDITEMPGRGFNSAFSGDVNVKYIKGISISAGGSGSDTGQMYIDHKAGLTVRYLNNNGDTYENKIVGIPVGATIEWQSTVAVPEGFLINDGREFSASLYLALAKVFPGLKLPDDRGLFKRALDSGKGYDSGRTLGSVQNDAMQNIKGTLGSPTIEGGSSASGAFSYSMREGGRAAGSGGNSVSWDFDASRQVRTANEFRPVNKAVIYITRVI